MFSLAAYEAKLRQEALLVRQAKMEEIQKREAAAAAAARERLEVARKEREARIDMEQQRRKQQEIVDAALRKIYLERQARVEKVCVSLVLFEYFEGAYSIDDTLLMSFDYLLRITLPQSHSIHSTNTFSLFSLWYRTNKCKKH